METDDNGAIGGFRISNDGVDPAFDPDSGSFPEPIDATFDTDDFERAASEATGAASSSQPSAEPPKTR